MAILSNPSVLADISEEPAFSEDGVDLTLIRWMLSMSPRERLLTLESFMHDLIVMQNGHRIP